MPLFGGSTPVYHRVKTVDWKSDSFVFRITRAPFQSWDGHMGPVLLQLHPDTIMIEAHRTLHYAKPDEVIVSLPAEKAQPAADAKK